MDKKPTTNKDLGIVSDYNTDKFASVRQKTKIEEDERYRKNKKTKKEVFPDLK